MKFDTSRASFFVHELSYCKCPTEEDLLRLYMRTLRNRSVAGHQLNRDSSRSKKEHLERMLPEKWLKPRPESGRDWLICAEFARQRNRSVAGHQLNRDSSRSHLNQNPKIVTD